MNSPATLNCRRTLYRIWFDPREEVFTPLRRRPSDIARPCDGERFQEHTLPSERSSSASRHPKWLKMRDFQARAIFPRSVYILRTRGMDETGPNMHRGGA